MTISLIETVAKRCEERRNSGEGNTWADEVTKRMACTNDLPAEEAIYHRKCFQYFMKPSKALPNDTDVLGLCEHILYPTAKRPLALCIKVLIPVSKLIERRKGRSKVDLSASVAAFIHTDGLSVLMDYPP